MQTDGIGVEAWRGETIESAHRVHAVVADASGNIVRSCGDPNVTTFLRSAAKPFQVLPLVASGAADAFGLTDAEIALACGSHSGEPRHVEAARAMLAKGGLDASALVCGAHEPLGEAGRRALAGAAPTRLHNNCSGKHAALALLQKHLGGDPAPYARADSLAQRAVLDAIARVSGVAARDVRVGVDGCGAPNFAVPLVAGARLFARLGMPQGVSKEDADALQRIARAMASFPEMVAGEARFDTDLMGASEDRLVTKAGAEGVQGVADRASGLGLFLKVEDGASRAVPPATVEALRQLAWLEGRAFEVLGEWWMPPVRNHAGAVVGRLKPVLRLDEA